MGRNETGEKDKYWEGFADGIEFANRLWGDTTADEMMLKEILEEHVSRIRKKK